MVSGVIDLQKLFKGTKDELSVVGRLAAGACAGMTSTLVSFASSSFSETLITELPDEFTILVAASLVVACYYYIVGMKTCCFNMGLCSCLLSGYISTGCFAIAIGC